MSCMNLANRIARALAAPMILLTAFAMKMQAADVTASLSVIATTSSLTAVLVRLNLVVKEAEREPDLLVASGVVNLLQRASRDRSGRAERFAGSALRGTSA